MLGWAIYFPEVGIVGDARTVLLQLIEAVPTAAGYVAAPFEDRPRFTEIQAAKDGWGAEMRERAAVTETPSAHGGWPRRLTRRSGPRTSS